MLWRQKDVFVLLCTEFGDFQLRTENWLHAMQALSSRVGRDSGVFMWPTPESLGSAIPCLAFITLTSQ